MTPWNTKAHNGLIEEKIELNLHLLSCLRSKTVHCRPWESLPVPEHLKYLLLGNLAQVLTPPIWRTAGKVALLLPRVTRIPGLSYFLESLKNLDPLTAMWPASVDIQPDKLGTWPFQSLSRRKLPPKSRLAEAAKSWSGSRIFPNEQGKKPLLSRLVPTSPKVYTQL